MMMADLVATLRGAGIHVHEHNIRYAVKTGRLPRPPLGRFGMFNFDSDFLALAMTYFSNRVNPIQEAPAIESV